MQVLIGRSIKDIHRSIKITGTNKFNSNNHDRLKEIVQENEEIEIELTNSNYDKYLKDQMELLAKEKWWIKDEFLGYND